jgi:H+-transporting ATPase
MSEHEEVVVVDDGRKSKSIDDARDSGHRGGGGHMNPEDRARASIDIARKGKHAAARKHGEFQPGAEDVESEGRKSLEEQMEQSQEATLEDFPLSEGLTSDEAKIIFDKVGPNKLPEKKTPKWLIFLDLLRGPLPYMLWLAALIEIGIQEWIDAGILFGILLGNAMLGYHETTKAGDAVDALKKSLKPSACVYRDGTWIKDFDATKLVPGDLVELGLGSTVPADCILNEGTIDVDESAMTGESFPVTLKAREMAKMGGTVARGETHATVVLTGPNTFFGKTAQMLNQGSGGYSNMQILLMRIVSVLVVSTLVLCFACFGYLLGIGVNIKESLDFFVAVVVSSIPLAIEIVATVTLALGSGQMSAYGAIVNRLAAIEDLAGMNMLCSDKTGTLTKNKMVIQEDAPAFMDGLNQMELLRYSALAAQWERPPKDALDTLVLRCHLWWDGYEEAKEKFKAEKPDATQVS